METSDDDARRKSKLPLALGLVAAGLVLAMAAVALRVPAIRGIVFYNEQFNAVRAEIQKHPMLTILNQRRHEDTTLEDFGFLISSSKGSLWLNIQDGSPVRVPGDRVAGIAFSAKDPPVRTVQTGKVLDKLGNPIPTTVVSRVTRQIRFDSPEWESRRLPTITTLADVIAHFEEITESLLAQPPSVQSHTWAPELLYLDP